LIPENGHRLDEVHPVLARVLRGFRGIPFELHRTSLLVFADAVFCKQIPHPVHQAQSGTRPHRAAPRARARRTWEWLGTVCPRPPHAARARRSRLATCGRCDTARAAAPTRLPPSRWSPESVIVDARACAATHRDAGERFGWAGGVRASSGSSVLLVYGSSRGLTVTEPVSSIHAGSPKGHGVPARSDLGQNCVRLTLPMSRAPRPRDGTGLRARRLHWHVSGSRDAIATHHIKNCPEAVQFLGSQSSE
jgi:hypothetical protein